MNDGGLIKTLPRPFARNGFNAGGAPPLTREPPPLTSSRRGTPRHFRFAVPKKSAPSKAQLDFLTAARNGICFIRPRREPPPLTSSRRGTPLAAQIPFPPYPPLTPPSEVSEGARRKNARSAHNPPQAIMIHNRKATVLAFMIRLCRIIEFGYVGGGPRTRNARRRIRRSFAPLGMTGYGDPTVRALRNIC